LRRKSFRRASPETATDTDKGVIKMKFIIAHPGASQWVCSDGKKAVLNDAIQTIPDKIAKTNSENPIIFSIFGLTGG